MKGFFDMVPKEVEEAALVDGAPRITIFRVIVLPLVASGLVVTSVFVFLFCYTEMQFAVVLTASRAMTMPLKLSGYVGINFAYLREMVAAALVSMIPIIVLFSVIQKHMVRGLTFGSIK
jgi:multiple sugar transport system permease protein